MRRLIVVEESTKLIETARAADLPVSVHVEHVEQLKHAVRRFSGAAWRRAPATHVLLDCSMDHVIPAIRTASSATWLAVVVRALGNEASHAYRGQADQLFESPKPPDVERMVTTPSPIELFCDDLALPQRLRVLFLAFFEGKSLSTIAREQGHSPSTVRTYRAAIYAQASLAIRRFGWVSDGQPKTMAQVFNLYRRYRRFQ